MSIKPILFNTEMVKAILEGRKTMTRRVVKEKGWKITGKPRFEAEGFWFNVCQNNKEENARTATCHKLKPPYQIGDIMYVRETFRVDYLSNIIGSGRVQYKADGSFSDIRFEADRYDIMRRANRMVWRPNENMPREAARIFLRVTDIRAEKLREITKIEAQQEGQPECTVDVMACGGQDSCFDCKSSYENAIRWFSDVWDSTIKPADLNSYGWNANPWVWVIEFERCEKPKEWGNV